MSISKAQHLEFLAETWAETCIEFAHYILSRISQSSVSVTSPVPHSIAGPIGDGAGLGLAIADAVVRATNGRWDVGALAADGASMSVTWPRILAGSRTASTAPGPAPAARPQPES